MSKKADPSIANAYRKDAFAVAKDDEIMDVLKCGEAQGGLSCLQSARRRRTCGSVDSGCVALAFGQRSGRRCQRGS